MQEGAEGVEVPQVTVSKAAEVVGNQGEVSLVKEIPFKRQPDLQAQLLAVSGGKFPDKPLSPDEIKQKLGVKIEQRWDWNTFNRISLQERKETGVKSVDEWKAKFLTWFNSEAHPKEYSENLKEVLKILGVVKVNDQTLQGLLDNYAGAESKMDAFIVKILELPELEKKMQAIQDLAGTLFGKEVAAQICSQIVDLERQIKEAGGIEEKIDSLTQVLTELAQKPSDETKEFIGKEKELYEKSKEKKPEQETTDEGKGKVGEEGSKKPLTLVELQKDTDTVGGYSDVGTDKEHHPNQEDRYGFNSDERKTVAVVADGVTVGGGGGASAENAVIQIASQLMGEKDMRQAIDKAREMNSEGDAAVVVAALGRTGALHYANVGDARVYVYKNEDLTQLSVDDEGVSEEGRPGITQSIKSYSDIHFGTDYVPEGGFVLLVVDGVYKRLGDAGIKQIIEQNKDKSPAEISKALVEAAKAVGCENVTVVTLKR